jgi:hypothetical protein
MIIEGTDDPRENIGKTIDFLTISTDGEYKRMEAEIAKVQTVSNAGRLIFFDSRFSPGIFISSIP